MDAPVHGLAPRRPRVTRELLRMSAECLERLRIRTVTYALRGRRETPHNALTSTDRTPQRPQRTRRPARTRSVFPRRVPRSFWFEACDRRRDGVGARG